MTSSDADQWIELGTKLQNVKLSKLGGGKTTGINLSFNELEEDLYEIEIHILQTQAIEALRLSWQVPATGVKGIWTTGALHEKRLRADWEPADCIARVSVDAPVICAFGHRDQNIISFALSDALNTSILRAPIREEDNLLYCSIDLFTEDLEEVMTDRVVVRVDCRQKHFAKSLAEVSDWWENQFDLVPMEVPDAALDPLYSTWYSYHQTVGSASLLEECKIAKTLGCEAIIIDDGWQTLDKNRGYDYTGDWEPEGMPDIAAFSDQVHQLGMKCLLWYSVPFCGVASKAYQQFKGKFLTENHRWAPVFDPRYPEVRHYLVDKYCIALKEYKLDGFKLDFIDDFRTYPETPLGKKDGRDFASVNAAVQKLLEEIKLGLTAIKPDILIEYRQRYIGPVVRRYGNMFRAFDCPADSVTNRIRTTDLRLVNRQTAIHSDMLTWHRDSSVEEAALQINSILFSVPQISIRLPEAPPAILEMIQFYLQFFQKNRDILLEGEFRAFQPLANYPILSAHRDGHYIFGYYGPRWLTLEEDMKELQIINGTLDHTLAIHNTHSKKLIQFQVYDCRGRLMEESEATLDHGITIWEIPPGGIMHLKLD